MSARVDPVAMRVRWLRVVLALAVVGAAGLLFAVPGALAAATQGTGTFARRDLFVAFVTLAVLCLALFGFDLRDWL